MKVDLSAEELLKGIHKRTGGKVISQAAYVSQNKDRELKIGTLTAELNKTYNTAGLFEVDN
jgi:hypothetical protein